MNVQVVVKPGSKKGPLLVVEKDGGVLIYVRERAQDGKANDAVASLLAKHYGVGVSNIRLVRGASGRHKVFHIT